MTTHVRSWALPATMACAALLTVSCGTQAPAPPPAAPPPAAPAASATPGYAAVLQPELERLAKDMLTTGAVVLVRSPEKGDWTTTIGTRTFRGSDPVQAGDHVRVGSNTKTWTGTVILQLVDEGRLSLDDPVAKYRPDVPNGQNITIRQLLEMRSGLYNYTAALELSQLQDNDPQRAFSPDELLAMAFERPPLYPPGQGYNYSNTNTVLLGTIIERLTGKPVAEEFRTRLFTRLGMTGSEFPTTSAIADPHPQGYTYGTNVQTVDTLVLPADVQAAAKAGTLAPMDVTNDNPSWAWTAGAGISTAADLATFAQALAGGGLLSPALQQERLSSVRPVDPGNPESPGYGLGLAKFGPLYGHTGELPGYNSFMGYDPDRKITVVVWASTAPTVDGRGPAVEMAKMVIGELYRAP